MTDHERVLESFRAKVARGDRHGIKVSMQLIGGMPGEQHLNRSVVIDEDRQASVRSSGDEAPEPAEARAQVEDETVDDVLRNLAEGVDGLVPRSQARFLPDSLVGSISVEVDGETTELFYLADEEDRITQNKPIPPAAAEALDALRRLSDQMLDDSGEGG
jgi:hypothetical protein